jgi:GT2 family glycosyltransferase
VQPERRAAITVAVATMDRPGRLERCVRALVDGSMLPAELIIVDQSATSETDGLVSRAGWDRILPVRYLRQPRLGLSASRNAAVAMATQRIVAFTDDDCVPDRRWVESLADAFAGATAPDAVTGRVLPLGPEQPGLYAVSVRASTARKLFARHAIPWAVGTGGNAAVAREWIERVGGFDERLGAGTPGLSAEDLDLFYRLLRAGARVQYEPAAVIYHERQTADDACARAHTYGFGLGACCARWLRQRDPYAMWILTRWVFDRIDTAARALLHGAWTKIREEAITTRSGLRGLAYGWTR